MKKYIALVYMLNACIFHLMAEGTREFRPTENDWGAPTIMDHPDYSDFGQYGAPDEQQIKIRVNDLDETIYFGFNNRTKNGGFLSGMPYRVVSPSGNIVYEGETQQGGAGHINNYDEAVSGPAQTGVAGGYNAIELPVDETGDYVLEFNLDPFPGEEVYLYLFDVTVADANNQPINGRLHSQGWQISTEAQVNPFRGVVYPYVENGVVYEVDMNGMQPYTFIIQLNSTGLQDTGEFLDDRVSRVGNYSVPEFPVFLNPPDEETFPTSDIVVSLQSHVTAISCSGYDFCFLYMADAYGHLEGFIDLNQNGVYDENIDIHFAKEIEPGDSICVDWDGRDNDGNLVDMEEYAIYSTFGFGLTHMPLYDVEHNMEGYRVNILKPEGLDSPLLFWDDSEIEYGQTVGGDGLVNLEGCLSETDGCHRWQNRGGLEGGRATQETINTWWYAKMLYDTLSLDMREFAPVQLSYNADTLIAGDTTVCKGDDLWVHIVDYGTGHYDNDRYTYEWYFDSNLLQGEAASQLFTIEENSEIVIKAIDNENEGCITFDTLHVEIVNPVQIDAEVEDELCDPGTGAIEVNLIDGPPNPQFFWQEFPQVESGSISGLDAGNYHLQIRDTLYSEGCMLDTSFTIVPAIIIAIDQLDISHTPCYSHDGKAAITMEDTSRSYAFLWSGSVGEYVIDTLAPGNHTVHITDVETGCDTDSSFSVTGLPFTVEIATQDEICAGSQGTVSLTLPDGDFSISYNGEAGNVFYDNLSSGNYDISVVADIDQDCRVDTFALINDSIYTVSIEHLDLEHTPCYEHNGSAAVTMAEPSRDYGYQWNGNVGTNQVSNLAPGNHAVHITDIETGCDTDSSFTISEKPFLIGVSLESEVCSDGSGAISLEVPNGDFEVYLDGARGDRVNENLSAGNYEISVVSILDNSCRTDTSVFLSDSTYTLDVEFEIEPLSGIIETDAELQFTAQSYPVAEKYEWDFDNGDFSEEQAPIVVFTDEGVFEVSLLVTDGRGCQGITRKTFDIPLHVPCEVNIPTAFSPNGDYVNDDIGVLGNAESIDLKIFNRWGEVIFRSRDIGNRWDGTYQGKQSPIGVYPFILDYECPTDGAPDKKRIIGEITLVR
ncbi:gliding motility-associated C-terminal domain-containing protein [Cytophagaceae bacterium ABcell3]|nr:gliding motility-associated C-terminal domain-containing protein [Cytophagaceae bacterium ABcell3]